MAQEWAGSIVDSDPTFPTKELIMFVELAQPAGKYYSKSEAFTALQTMGYTLGGSQQYADKVSGLVLLHPVDPLNFVLEKRDGDTILMWHRLRDEAQLLYTQLCEGTWQEVLDHSTLGPVFRA